MKLVFEERESDSPFVERIWRTQSAHLTAFTSVAVRQWDLVFWKQAGKSYVAVQGPETHASVAPVPENAEFFGILFKTGSYLHPFPVSMLVNSYAELPAASSQRFWLQSAAWELPTYENADTFVARLARAGLLAHEPVVHDVLSGQQPGLSQRSVQRRFLQATGLTHTAIQQIDRARHAAVLLQQGISILDTVHEAGFFDQSHLTRSLKHYIGHTPAQLLDKERAAQLSFLYNPQASC